MPYRKSRLFSLFFGSLVALSTALPAWSAERVYFKFGSLELPLSVPELAKWSETGEAEPELDTYIGLLTLQQQAQLRELLKTRYDENYFNLSYMAYTTIGERFLKNVGQLVRTREKGNGFQELQTAFVNASKADEGLSFISVLQQYPDDMEIDVAQILGLVQRAKGLVSETDAFMAKVSEVASTTAQGQSLKDLNQPQASQALTAASPQPDIRQKGALNTVLTSLQVQGSALKFDLYHPQQPAAAMPVVVITAGFGSEQDFFEDLAHHLASYGFAVAVPEHAGSNKTRRRAFFAGQHKELFPVTEYVNRPQEVSAVLDDLDRRNAGQFKNQLNLNDVGIFGHSFGGPTALSLGGAELNFQQLQQKCGDQMDLLNISLYYQCFALKSPRISTQLRDPRVKALFLLGPFSSALFGPQGMSQLDLPVLWEATDIDLPAPLLLEQIPLFKTMTTPDRYLAVSEGLPHAHITFEVISGLVKEGEVERLEELSMTYQKALTVAFFKTHVAQDETFRPYLQSVYTKSISEAPYSLHFLDAEASQKLF